MTTPPMKKDSANHNNRFFKRGSIMITEKKLRKIATKAKTNAGIMVTDSILKDIRKSLVLTILKAYGSKV